MNVAPFRFANVNFNDSKPFIGFQLILVEINQKLKILFSHRLQPKTIRWFLIHVYKNATKNH